MRETYRCTVREFQRFLDRCVVVADPDDVRRWCDELGARGKCPATIARELSKRRRGQWPPSRNICARDDESDDTRLKSPAHVSPPQGMFEPVPRFVQQSYSSAH
jgi:hypothetical protein